MIEKYSLDIIKKSVYTTLRYSTNIAPHSHYFWEFSYCVDCNLIHKINDTSLVTHPLTEIVLIKPNDIHEIIQPATEANSKTAHYRDIYVTSEKMKKCCDFLDSQLYDTLLQAPVISLNARRDNLESLEQNLSIFQSYYGALQENIELLDKLHTTIIFQLLGIYIRNSSDIKKRYPTWINDFMDKCSTEVFLCDKIQNITQSLHYSHGYLCREFKKYLGKTMAQYLKERRIIYSTILLLDTNLSILDIAMRLNFSSQSAYINAFKSLYKIPPNQWRAHYKKTSKP